MNVQAYTGALTPAHWDLLLMADPWFEAVRAYTPPQQPQAEFFVIGKPSDPYALCVLVPIKDGFEIKNIATKVMLRRHGMASALIRHVITLAQARNAAILEIGTATTSTSQIRLYEKLGFKKDGILREFFSRYPVPIIENGALVRDMQMLRFDLQGAP